MNVKRGSTIFLKVIIFLAGIAVLALCIYWLPEATRRDALANPDYHYQVYPLLVCAYGICITFSVALYHVFKLLTYIERNNAFTELSLKSLKVIKRCAFTVIFFILFVIVDLMVLAKTTGDDAAGPISLSLMGIFAASIVAVILEVLQKPIIHLLDKKEVL
ncbi:DUF2975 domain-containing protein [Paenibacillus sp. UNC499MF]|uniref:DUF2975 domain-containing protein n=1 Tax=Paenibacillus sp. UNC499MF TaxID=1502751 RepID=UPI00089FFB86|nr:DUF2975 domain-containing protein [Paenibacillus sp. UNC499MF]SEG42664.1 Protein of unknown function [Paenibacillus sp. UNC499MF]